MNEFGRFWTFLKLSEPFRTIPNEYRSESFGKLQNLKSRASAVVRRLFLRMTYFQKLIFSFFLKIDFLYVELYNVKALGVFFSYHEQITIFKHLGRTKVNKITGIKIFTKVNINKACEIIPTISELKTQTKFFPV